VAKVILDKGRVSVHFSEGVLSAEKRKRLTSMLREFISE
jgi:hypothetical protein